MIFAKIPKEKTGIEFIVRDDGILRISGCPADIDLRYFEKIWLGQLRIRYPNLKVTSVNV